MDIGPLLVMSKLILVPHPTHCHLNDSILCVLVMKSCPILMPRSLDVLQAHPFCRERGKIRAASSKAKILHAVVMKLCSIILMLTALNLETEHLSCMLMTQCESLVLLIQQEPLCIMEMLKLCQWSTEILQV